MTTVNCSGNEELDFRLIFGEDSQQHSLGPADGEPDHNTPYYTQSLGHQPTGQDLQSHHASLPSPAPFQAARGYPQPLPDYEAQGIQYSSLGPPKAFDCPSIQITSIAPNCHQEAGSSQDLVSARGSEGEGPGPERSWSRDHLHLSLDPCYRDSALSHSPCSSLSSRSWLSDVSSCESFSHIYDDVEAELSEAASRFTLGSPLASPGCGGGAFGVEIWQQQYQHPLGSAHSLSPHQSPHQSPCASPRQSPRNSVTDENWLNPRPASRSSSRPTSPGGKRRHSSADISARSPSPHHSPSPTTGHSPRGSVTEDSWGGSPATLPGPLLYSYPELDVPSKTRRTSGALMGLSPGQGDPMLEDAGVGLPFLDSPGDECVAGLNQDGLAELFLSVPSHFTWIKPKPGNMPLFRPSSLPPLDWPLPSQAGLCELQVEVQPRSHHRAHYETEGSRGAVKAASGGHPVVKLMGYSEKPVNLQVFIGTADDRYMRPHAFYQVHRVTGKTVSTACQEKILSCTKVLEIPLLPENNMSTSIDCAGILKLRNSDIELRKGETDIGRKNTRVRMAFRVNIPQPNGKVLCLQAASTPIECSQRSAQELPQVESFSPASCSVSGGEELTITGSNISLDTKVVFVEKGLDGRTQWEVDAKVIREKSSGSNLVVQVPAYHSKSVSSSVQVQFYVSNGKRKRSLTRGFTYLGATTHRPPSAGDGAAVTKHVKQEHGDADYMTHNPPGRYPACAQLPSPDPAFTRDASFYGSSGHPVPCGQLSQPGYTPSGSSPHQHPPQLHGYVPGMEQQRISPMQTVNPTPAPRTRPSYQPTAQYSVPYNSQSGSAAPQASQPLLVQVKMAAPGPSQREGLMHQSHTQAQPSSSAPQPTDSQARAYTSTQLYYSDQGDLNYRSTRDVSASYSPTPAGTVASSSPSPASFGGGGRHQAPCPSPSRGSLACMDPQKNSPSPHSIFSHSGERVSIKQEPEDQLALGTVGLQEITLDDVNEIIDRDISELGGVTAEAVQPGQDHYGWDPSSSEAALTFCGLH